jgi:hypothetical protein
MTNSSLSGDDKFWGEVAIASLQQTGETVKTVESWTSLTTLWDQFKAGNFPQQNAGPSPSGSTLDGAVVVRHAFSSGICLIHVLDKFRSRPKC